MVEVGVAGQGASDREVTVVEQNERDGVDDSVFGPVLIIRSGVDEHSLRLGLTFSRLAESPGEVRGTRSQEVVALDDQGVCTVV